MRPIAITNEERLPEHRKPGFQWQELPHGVIPVDDVTGGMVTSVPTAQIPANSWLELRNARVREGELIRRPGTQVLGVKPDSNPILRLVTIIDESGSSRVVRVTPSSAHVTSDGEVWTALTHDLSGVEARYDVTRMFDWLFFSNGDEKIRVFRPDANSLLEIDEAPRAAAITNFGDRIVAGGVKLAVGGERPNTIAWSKNSDPFDWTDETAGNEDLIQGQGGFGDGIVRLFGLTNELVILRRRSIWHAQRQALAAAPFRFGQVINGVGCDLPHTAVETEGAIIFADQRTKSVYAYQPGSRPQAISAPISRELFLDLQNLIWAKGSYDPYNKEYHLGICTSVATQWITKVWVFSLTSGAWSYDDSPEVSEIGIVSMPSDITTIDELIDTIDAQVGSIDELSEAGGLFRPRLFKGTETGEFIEQTVSADTDWDASAFEFEAVSQNLGSQQNRRTMKDLLVKFYAEVNTTLILEHSVNGTDWRNTKSNVFLAQAGNVRNGRLPKKLTTGSRLHFRIRCSTGSPRILAYWTRIMEKGLQR